MGVLEDGESVEVQGSGSARYTLRRTGPTYSCTCPAWRNQSVATDVRTCKHLRRHLGDAEETARVGPGGTRPPATGGTGAAARGAKETAPPLLLAHTWENDVDLAGWWMSEKLDGVRAYWDGRQFVSRLGNTYPAPGWFVEGLPPFPLDGELWAGRKRFQRTISIVRAQDRGEHWKEVQYVVFDAPAHEAPFEARLEHVRVTLAAGAPSWVRVHEHERVRDVSHLREELARVESLGGEGLMLRRPASRYEVGRSSTLLKVKTFHDAEARVVEHLPGAGRHEGRLGALLVEMPSGTRFSVGTGFSDRERASPPPIGALVTYRFQELSPDGVPRFPTYVGVRHDVAWPAAAPPVDAPQAPPEKPSPPPKVAPPASSAPSAKRRFELVEGSSSKFWEIEQRGAEHVVCFGRIGTAGQTRTKAFASLEAAAADVEQLVAEKTRKGYVSVEGKE
jgi:DNA ligase-1